MPMENSSGKPTVEECLTAVSAANGSAEYLMAYDRAMSGLDLYPDDPRLKFQAVLALARSGAAGRAAEAFSLLGLENSRDEDIAALGARLLKDRFFAASSDDAPRIAAQSAERYEKVFHSTGGYYPAINAAAMWLFAGDGERSAGLAAATLKIVDGKLGRADEGELYWLEATKAEALLLLRDLDGVAVQMERIAAMPGRHVADLASTRTQLRRICSFTKLDCAFLNRLQLPNVLHYTGHMIAPPGGRGRFGAGSEERVAKEIALQLEELDIGFGYGSLACGGDIMVAEALLLRGAELHLVFPFAIDDFLDISVRNGGPGWEERFHHIKDRACSITFASSEGYLGDAAIFAYTSRIAMGLARIRAQNIGNAPLQLAVWDGVETGGDAGTSADIAFWRKHGLPSHVIDSGPPATGVAPPVQARSVNVAAERTLAPVLFTDMKGYSGYSENEVMIFVKEVMGRLAAIINRHEKSILYRNTWGDAIFLVFADVATAIHCVLELQACLKNLPLAAMGLPHDTGMRMAMHAGPVFESHDPILDKRAYFGSTLTRAARMEPITPVGEVYVSDAFAALAAFEGPEGVACEYVGHMPTAKSYGLMRMFHLTRQERR